MSKKLLFFIACGVLFIFILSFFFIQQVNGGKISPEGAAIGEEELTRDIKVLIRKPMKVKRVEFWHNGQYPVNPKTEDFKMDQHTGSAISIIGTVPGPTDVRGKEPHSIREAMRIWIYLDTRKPSIPVDLICTAVTRRPGMDRLWWIGVMKSDFEEWYIPLKNSGLSEDDILSKLTDNWIAKYPIVSYWNIK